MIGIGSENCTIALYIGKIPPLKEYLALGRMVPAYANDLSRIGLEAGNHWRKILNIYAKLGFSLNTQGYKTWQLYRDQFLLSKNSQQALLFNTELVNSFGGYISLVCGKAYSNQLLKNQVSLTWLDDEFAVNVTNKVIVTPYFDYRQLSNIKIEQLVNLIRDYS